MNAKIYVLTSTKSVPGQGESTEYPVLEQHGSHGWDWKGWYPAFTSRLAAQVFADKHPNRKLSVVELDLI